VAVALFAFAVMASGCGESTTDGDGGSGGSVGSGGAATDGSWVGGQEAETHCREWCLGCSSNPSDPERCRHDCRRELAATCGEHVAAEHDCITALACRDPFNDCDQHRTDYATCQTDLTGRCFATCTFEGDLVEREEQLSACRRSGGDCDADPSTNSCEFLVRAGQCPDVASCLEHGGGCPDPR